MFLIFLNAMFVASLFIESVKLCASYLPSEGSPDNRLNEKSHSSKISLRKVALNKRNIYFSFLLLGTALSAVSRIIQCYRVLSARNLLYFCCTFFYRRLVSLDFTAFICPKTSSSGLLLNPIHWRSPNCTECYWNELICGGTVHRTPWCKEKLLSRVRP